MTHVLPVQLSRRSVLYSYQANLRRFVLATAPHVLLVAAAVVATSTTGLRAMLALGLGVGAVAMAALAPRQLLIAVMVWLPLLGLLRRVLSWTVDVAGSDPLLLVGPAALASLAVVAIERGALRDRTTLAKGVLALSVLAVLSVANPNQGGPMAGLGGLLFFLVPMLGFWIGRAFVDDALLHQMAKVIAVVALLTAAYGLWQVYVAFLPWDARWIDENGYTALTVGDRIRPFSTFASSAEYAYFCALGVMVWFALGLRLSRAALAFTATAVLATAIFLQGSRGIVVVLVVTLGIVIAVRLGVRTGPTILLGALLLFGLQTVASSYGDGAIDSAGARTGSLVSHQVSGLSQPFDPQSSTLLTHVTMVRDGVLEAFRNPLGHGVGSVTLGGMEFGAFRGSTEADPSNAAVALGLPGLLAYAVVVTVGLRTVYTVARGRGDLAGTIAVGLTFLLLLQWFNGGMYAVAPIPWLMMGWADRQRMLGSGPTPDDARDEHGDSVVEGHVPKEARGAR